MKEPGGVPLDDDKILKFFLFHPYIDHNTGIVEQLLNYRVIAQHQVKNARLNTLVSSNPEIYSKWDLGSDPMVT